jgi:hypothetical protein
MDFGLNTEIVLQIPGDREIDLFETGLHRNILFDQCCLLVVEIRHQYEKSGLFNFYRAKLIILTITGGASNQLKENTGKFCE